MPAFDINAILSAALATAVAEATAPLVARIEALEINIAMMQNSIDQKDARIAALENNPAIGVDTTLERRVAALETHTTVLDQHGGLLEYLDNQEWFWEKVRNFTDVAAERAINEHTELYDHDDYDNHISDDDRHFEGDIEDAVRDALSNMTFDVSIR